VIENIWAAPAVGGGILALAGFTFLGLRRTKQPDLSLSQKERMFSSVLEKAVGGKYRVYCKVPMVDVFEATDKRSERSQRKALKPVRGILFDYIVCDSQTHEVVCAVELDDHQFDKKTFKEKDLFVEQLCQDVGLPLLRVAPQNGYNLVEIIERFERTIVPVDYVREAKSKFKLRVTKSFTKPSQIQ
jgi:hypothetical protein